MNDLIVDPSNTNTAAPLVIGITVSIGAVFVAAILAVLLFAASPAGAAGAAAPVYGSKAHAL